MLIPTQSDSLTLSIYRLSKFQLSAASNFNEDPDLKIWNVENIDFEKSFPTNTNMTYFACVKAEIIASEVETAKKVKNFFFRFLRYRKS